MKDFLLYFFKGFFLFFSSSDFRTLVRLFLINVVKKRYTEYTVRANSLQLRVTDIKSFVWQYQEIFFHKFYAFNTSSVQPIIYDCGANIGTSVLFFAKNYPAAKIVAYEASPYVFSFLKNNIDHNNIQNVILHQNAVWNKNETLDFNDEGADAGSLYTVSNTKKIKVIAVDLLEALSKESKIDMLKIDIEGAEDIVIPHIAPVLFKIDRIFFEYHSFNGKEQKLDEILLLLRKNKFRFYIRHANNRNSPFINTAKDKDMDMQLNIFAYKD